MPAITVRGLPEVQRNLSEFPRLLVMSCFAKALARAAAVFEDELRARTPETDFSTSSEEYGHLSEAIMDELAIDTQGRGGRVRIGFGQKDFVARFVEYGHRMVSHRGHVTGTVAPHPFMRPAFEAAAAAALDAFINTVNEFMESGAANG
jgi:HK97 gp10 family phage protein